VHDAVCCVRNLIRDPRVVPGGGASEIAASLAVSHSADLVSTVEQYAMRGFADALEDIPTALAENSGLASIQHVSDARAAQIAGGSSHGIDCMQSGSTDMWKQNVYESCASKVQQLRLATQVVKMILKIDDVISSTDYE